MAAELTNAQIDSVARRYYTSAMDPQDLRDLVREAVALATQQATQGAEPVGFVHYRSTGLGSTVREAVLTPAGLELPDGALLYTAPPPKAKCTCVYATAKNTPAVRQGYEMGGYVKSSAGCPVHDTAPPPTAEVEKDAEIARLQAIINTPQADDFLRAVSIEAEHQRQRWGSEHDAGKTPADWFWLVGYLAGKALHSHAAGNLEKGEHHVITTAAACANWHRAMFGKTDMRPGIDGDAALQSDQAQAAKEPKQ